MVAFLVSRDTKRATGTLKKDRASLKVLAGGNLTMSLQGTREIDAGLTQIELEGSNLALFPKGSIGPSARVGGLCDKYG